MSGKAAFQSARVIEGNYRPGSVTRRHRQNPSHRVALPGFNRGFWRRLGAEEALTLCFFDEISWR